MRRLDKYLVATFLIGITGFGISCNKNPDKETGNPTHMNSANQNQDVLTDNMTALNEKTIFFGHQSVGFNIVDGIQDILMNHPGLKLNVREEDSLSNLAFGEPALFHARIGENGEPF